MTSSDIAERMLASLAAADGVERSTSTEVEVLWDACTVLAEAGVLVADEEHLGALRRGPFRIAATRYEHQVLDFVDVLFPTGVVAAATGRPGLGALTAGARLVCKVFTDVLRRGVVFGRDDVSRLRFAVLLAVDAAKAPMTVHEVTRSLVAQGLIVESDAVVDALTWLTSAPSVSGADQELLAEEADGSYVSRI